VTRPLAWLALVTLVAGCHDFAALSFRYGADLGSASPPDLGPAGDGADLSPAGDGHDLSPPGQGHIAGSGAATPVAVNLTSEGPVDWAHFGYPVGGDKDSKANTTSQISYYSTLSGYTATGYANNTVGFSWDDGTLTQKVDGTLTGMYRTGVADGFQLTVEASTQERTLAMYVGGYRSNGKLTASLSDQSAPDYADATFSRTDSTPYNVTYTIRFAAAHDGQKLTVTWAAASVSNDGNVTLQGAALR
jgi:hypothetical protein